MNKKIRIILAAVMIAAVFTACTNSTGNTDENASEANGSNFAFSEESSSPADITNAQIDAPSNSSQKNTDNNVKNNTENDDNEIPFEANGNNSKTPSSLNQNTTASGQISGEKNTTAAAQESTTKKTESATDKDGWITKWY